MKTSIDWWADYFVRFLFLWAWFHLGVWLGGWRERQREGR